MDIIQVDVAHGVLNHLVLLGSPSDIVILGLLHFSRLDGLPCMAIPSNALWFGHGRRPTAFALSPVLFDRTGSARSGFEYHRSWVKPAGTFAICSGLVLWDSIGFHYLLKIGNILGCFP